MKVNEKELQGRAAECTVFFNIASVFGHEVVHINSTALSIYSNCAGVFLMKLKR